MRALASCSRHKASFPKKHMQTSCLYEHFFYKLDDTSHHFFFPPKILVEKTWKLIQIGSSGVEEFIKVTKSQGILSLTLEAKLPPQTTVVKAD